MKVVPHGGEGSIDHANNQRQILPFIICGQDDAVHAAAAAAGSRAGHRQRNRISESLQIERTHLMDDASFNTLYTRNKTQ